MEPIPLILIPALTIAGMLVATRRCVPQLIPLRVRPARRRRADMSGSSGITAAHDLPSV